MSTLCMALVCSTNGALSSSSAPSDSRHEQIEQSIKNLSSVCTALNPSFSPDGKEVAFRSNLNGTYQVWIVPTDGGYPRLVTNVDRSVHGVEWSPVNNDLLAFGIGQGELESQIYVIHSDGTGQKLLTPALGSRNYEPTWTADGRYIFGSSNARKKTVDEPCFINAQTGEYKWLLAGKKSGRLLNCSSNSKYGLIDYFSSFNDGDCYLIDIEKASESLVMPNAQPARVWGTFAPDNQTIYLITNALEERQYLARTKIGADGKTGPLEIVAKKPDANLSFRYDKHTLLNPSGTQAALIWSKGDYTNKLELLDLTSEKSPQAVPLPKGYTQINNIAFSPDGKLLALALGKDLTADELADDIWLLDLETTKFKQLTYSPHPGVNFEKLVHPEYVQFNSYNGLQLTGCVYKPIGKSSPSAYVIDFHGGPDGVATPTFEYQPFLEQGIGVFAPNVRGSGGRGKSFAALDDGALRVNAVKDIKACVDYLISNKLADPKKIGVMGHSAGGYLSMSALTDYPEMFAAGIEDNGPINLLSYVRIHKSKGFDCSEFSGPVVDEQMLKDLSPAFKLDKIKAPFLIVQGATDTCTPAANDVAKTLKQIRSDFEYIVFADEGHNMDKTKDKIAFTVAKVEFFVKHLKP